MYVCVIIILYIYIYIYVLYYYIMHICICIHTCIHICIHIFAYIYIYIYIQIQICIHVYVHTHIHRRGGDPLGHGREPCGPAHPGVDSFYYSYTQLLVAIIIAIRSYQQLLFQPYLAMNSYHYSRTQLLLQLYISMYGCSYKQLLQLYIITNRPSPRGSTTASPRSSAPCRSGPRT